MWNNVIIEVHYYVRSIRLHTICCYSNMYYNQHFRGCLNINVGIFLQRRSITWLPKRIMFLSDPCNRFSEHESFRFECSGIVLTSRSLSWHKKCLWLNHLHSWSLSITWRHTQIVHHTCTNALNTSDGCLIHSAACAVVVVSNCELVKRI